METIKQWIAVVAAIIALSPIAQGRAGSLQQLKSNKNTKTGLWMDVLKEIDIYSRGDGRGEKYKVGTIKPGQKFEVLEWNQHMSLVRLDNGKLAFLRRKVIDPQKIGDQDWQARKDFYSKQRQIASLTPDGSAGTKEACEQAGNVWHVSPDNLESGHCHEGATVTHKVDPADVAKADALADQPKGCGAWQSPMREKYRITDCVGSSRPTSRVTGKKRQHAGLDLNTYPSKGKPADIYPVAPGKIIQAGWQGGYGCVIKIQHDNCPGEMSAYKNFSGQKCISFYAHLKTLPNKKCPQTANVGQKVSPCENKSLAKMGSTGGNYPVHLHFEMHVQNASDLRLNPLVVLRDIEKNKNYHSSKNPRMCKASRGWLAANARGFGTHSSNPRRTTPPDSLRTASKSGARR